MQEKFTNTNASQEILNSLDNINKDWKEVTATIAENAKTSSEHKLNINDLTSQLHTLHENLTELTIKFDVWQSNVEPMLATSQTAMTYDNYVLTALAIIVAVFTFIFQLWSSKSKKEAIEEASVKFDKAIARGLMPEGSKIRNRLLNTILSSPQFISAVRKANEYMDTSIDTDETNNLENINSAAIKRAKDQKECPK